MVKNFIPSKEVASYILAEEFFGILIFGAWTYVRGFAPDLDNLEKFMDFGFIQASMRAQSFPPQDIFLGGEVINYYYYGHYVAGYMTTLADLPGSLGFNLRMNFLLSSFALASFSTGLLMHRLFFKSERFQILTGILCTFFVSFGGNMHAFYYNLIETPKKWWYADSTRFIPFTIHEFPIYTFITNDMHGHTSNLPYAAMTLALIATLFWKITSEQSFSRGILPTFLVTCFLIGTCYVTNALDFVFFLVLAGASIWLAYASLAAEKPNFLGLTLGLFRLNVLKKIIGYSIALVSVSVMFFAPFWVRFVPFSTSFELLPDDIRSTFHQLFILWGTHFPLASLLVLAPMFQFALKNSLRVHKIKVFCEKISTQFLSKNKLTEEIVNRKTAPFLIGVFIVALIMIICPEIFYIKDIYPQHPRANTLFKFYFQSFQWLGYLSAVGFVFVLLNLKRFKWFIRPLLFLTISFFIFSSAAFLYYALPMGVNLKGTRIGNDGFLIYEKKNPDEFAAMKWLMRRSSENTVIAESVGTSYTAHARVSAMTGIPSVIGWLYHEWLWRGSMDKPIRPMTYVQSITQQPDTLVRREAEVRSIYESPRIEEVLSVVKKYDVEFIFVGIQEIKLYPKIDYKRFANAGFREVFRQNDVRIFSTR